MDKIPLMGFTRGIFEIFVPGVFLLLNFYFALYMTPYTSETLKNLSSNINEIILALIIFSFSYLLGVILRILRATWADKLSGYFLSLTHIKNKSNLSYTDNFPYEKYNRIYYKETFNPDKLYNDTNQDRSEIINFFQSKWIIVNNSLSFNLIKMMLICEDEIAAKEIYAAESLSRYISSMLYCLLISVFILLLVLVIDIVYFDIGKKDLFIGLGPVFVMYLFGILAILHNFRIIRRKEVDTVFALAFKYRERLFSSKGSGSAPRNGNDKQEPT